MHANHDHNDIIDVEAVEIEDGDNLPAVIPAEASNSETIELPNRQDSLLADNPERRCVATNSRGQRCRKFAIYGSTVCRTHGGATKRVREAARIRVENASNRLMGKLIEFAFDDTKPPDVQLKAIQNSLDRAGLKPTAEVVLSQGETKPYETVFDSIGGEPQTAGFPSGTTGDGNSAGVDASPAPAYDPYADSGQAGAGGGGAPDATGGYGAADYQADEYAQPSGDTGPLREADRQVFDRDRRNQRAERHITGEDAIRAANWANAAMAESHGLPWGESAHRDR
jgi:hypothetical protein